MLHNFVCPCNIDFKKDIKKKHNHKKNKQDEEYTVNIQFKCLDDRY